MTKILGPGYLGNKEIHLVLANLTRAVPEKGYLPAYFFQIRRCRDETLLGSCTLRVGETAAIAYSGHYWICYCPRTSWEPVWRPKPYPFYCRLGFAVGCGRLSSPASRTTWLRAAPACLQAEFLLALCRFLVGMKCILPDARRSAATFLCRRNIKIRQKKDRRFFECW